MLILHNIYNIDIADRTLRYHRLNFKINGIIYCKRRWARRDDGTVFMMTTAMAITIAGYKDLVKMGHPWARPYIKRLIQKYGPESDTAKKPPAELAATRGEPGPQKPPKSHFDDPEFRKRRGLKPLLPRKTKNS